MKPVNDHETGAERRFYRRQPCRVRAVAQLSTTQAKCLIRDRSVGGMRLVFRSPTVLEPEFGLVQAGGQTRRVRLIWTDDHQAGVAFIP